MSARPNVDRCSQWKSCVKNELVLGGLNQKSAILWGGGLGNVRGCSTHTGELLSPSLVSGISSIASLHHILIFSACKQCLCQRRTPNISRIWLGGERCPRQGFGHEGEMLRPRFHMLCRLQLPEDLEIKKPNCSAQWRRRVLILPRATPFQADCEKQWVPFMSSWAQNLPEIVLC